MNRICGECDHIFIDRYFLGMRDLLKILYGHRKVHKSEPSVRETLSLYQECLLGNESLGLGGLVIPYEAVLPVEGCIRGKSIR